MAQKFLSDIHATAGVKDSSGDLGTSGQVLSSTGSLTNWVNPTVGTTVIYKDTFYDSNAATDGQTVFTLANTVDSEDKTQVYIDGAYQSKGGYTVSGTTLTFDTGLETEDSEVEVITFSTATANNAASAVKLDTFTGDGSDLTFVLSEAVVDEKVTQVYINGVYQNKSTYSIAADLVTLTFGSGNAPPNSSAIEVISFKTITSTDGTLTATTFLGDLNGTINTATTATTQSAGNNSTLVATTEFATTALNLKSNIASPTFTGTVGGITKAMVGLSNVDNTTDALKPVSTAGQTALDLKANIAGPTFTGTPAAPTASAGTNTTQLATTAFVNTGIANIVDSAPGTLNTLNELAAALGDDVNFSTTVTDSIATKLPLTGGTLTGKLSVSQSGAEMIDLTRSSVGTYRLAISNSDAFSVFDVGANADRFVISSSGNVGIGTASTSSKLHIRTSAGFNYEFEEVSSKLRLSALNDARDTNVPLQFAASEFNFITGAATFGGNLKVEKSLNGDPQLIFVTNPNSGTATEAAIYVGNAALGATSAAAFMQTLGTGFSSTGGFIQDGSVIGTGTSISGGLSLMVRANADMRFYTNGHTNQRMAIKADGKVGIGTASPAHKLSVNQNTYASGSDAPEAALGITIGDYWTTSTGAALTIKNAGHRGAVGHESGSPLFRADFNNATGMILDKNGHVGIGTASPGSKLTVVGGTSTFVYDNSPQGTASSVYRDAVFGSTQTVNTGITIFGTGQTGISFGDAGSNIRGQVRYQHSSDTLELGTSGNLYMSISSTGGITSLSDGGSSGAFFLAGSSSSVATGKVAIGLRDGMIQFRNPGDYYHKMWYYDGVNISTNSGHGHFRVYGDSDNSLRSDDAENTLRLSVDTVTGNIGTTDGGSNIFNNSDQRIKENILTLPSMLSKVKALRAVSFDWKYKSGETGIYGFIAQEVQEIDASLVFNNGDTCYRNDKTYGEDLELDGIIEDTLAINERRLIPVLVKAIQEQQTIIEDLKSRIETLEG